MNAPTLLATLAARGLTVVADGRALFVRPRERLTDELRTQIRAHKPAILAALHDAANDAPTETDAEAAELQQEHQDDPAMEARRQRVLEILAEHPGFRYAVVTDTKGEPDVVVVHVGIRGVGSGEIVVAKGRYDGVELLRALDNAEGTS